MLNVVALNGRLCADPELKQTNNGVPVATFSIAVERAQKDKDGNRMTDFFQCVAWRNTAEFICKWFKKGSLVGISGELQTRKYTDKEGKARTAFEIIVNQTSFCGGKAEDEQPKVELEPAPQNNTFAEITEADDLPF